MKPQSFAAAVQETMTRRDLVPVGPILAAVSGGADSLALMHVLHALGYDVEVAHFDHRVREGSDRDAVFVERQAGKLGLTTHAGSAGPSDRRAAGESPETWLRRIRLAFLEHTASVIGATKIATGHTQDDQAETVLMRAIGGAGTKGLSGIAPARGPYIRPLIDRSRVETQAYCTALRLRPLKDPTNDDLSYRRNAIRADLLPHIATRYNAQIAATLARTADVLRDEDRLLDALAAEALQPDAGGGAVRIEVDALAALHPALQRRVIRRAASLGADHTERVRLLGLEGETGDQIFLPQGLNARLEYGFLVIGPAPSSPVRSETVPLEVPGTTDLPDRAARIRATVTTHRPSPLPDGVEACAVDAGVAAGPLVVRAPKPGDRFRPLGMRGAKKLGDYFTDVKLPRSERASVPVVASRDAVVWVVGHRIDDAVKVTGSSRRILILEWER